MTIVKLPLAKDAEAFDFSGAPLNEDLVREQATGNFLADQRNLSWSAVVGKIHLGVAIACARIRSDTRGGFFNVVDLVNRLETEGASPHTTRTAKPPKFTSVQH